MHEMNKIIRELIAYGNQLEETGRFSTNDLLSKMEPIYNNVVHDNHIAKPRILILFGGGVGDFVLLSPCLREIRRIYEHAIIFFVGSENTYNLSLACPYIDQAYFFDYIHRIDKDREIFYWECVAFTQKFFPHPFDISFNFSSFFSGTLLAYMSGARERFLFLSAEDWWLFHNQIPYAAAQALSTVLYPEKVSSPHMVDRYLAILDNLLHYPVYNRELETWYPPEDLAIVKKLLPVNCADTLIAIGIGGCGHGRKSWPSEKYIQLMQQILHENSHLHFIITGGPSEKDTADFITQHFPADKITSLAGRLTYRQTSALLSLCHYYIGNDTGTMHLAAANHVPILVVFAYAADLLPEESSIVERYYPYHVPSVVIQPDHALPECLQHLGHPLQKMLGCVANHPHCIAQVTVEEMYQGYLALREM